MKAEINNENKARFFALYFGQRVLPVRVWGSANDVSYHLFQKRDLFEASYLELTPLSAITDEDAIEVAKIVHTNNSLHVPEMGIRYINHFVRASNHHYHGDFFSFTNVSSIIDFLRSKGYALPWMGLTVDELIAAGWVKLREV